MKLTLGVALGALLAGLGAILLLPAMHPYADYISVAIVFLGAVSAYLHANNVDGGTDGGPQAPPPSG